MKTCIALFRGLNIGGHNLLPMKELTSLLAGLGLRDVKTYIQSGNAVFRCREQNAATLSERITAAIMKNRGFAPLVLVLDPAELDKVVASNPFPEAEDDPKSLHVLFLTALPKAPNLDRLEQSRGERERFSLRGRVFYLHAPDGVGRSKLAAGAERLLGVPITGRNWRSVLEIAAMAKVVAGKGASSSLRHDGVPGRKLKAGSTSGNQRGTGKGRATRSRAAPRA